jgi:membrane protein required for beta-lactamase induction
VLVLAYCLGLESFNDRVNDYLHACESHDRRQAKELAELLVGRPVPENIHQQTREVATAILYESNTRIFAVIFWFILLGPAGALLYRIAILLLRDSEDAGLAHLTQSAEKIFAWLDWAPTRLLSLSFFLTGSFDDALKAWKQVVLSELDMAESNRSIVINTGCGAMQHDVEEALMDDPLEGMLDEYDLHWVRAARALVIRSLVAWLAFVALMTIIALFTMFAAFI